jgi:hypothetical protein
MPRGIPGSGPNAGRGKGRKTKTHTLADIAARSGSGTGQQRPVTVRLRLERLLRQHQLRPVVVAAVVVARPTSRRGGTGTRGQRAGNGQQRADQTLASGQRRQRNETTDINGVKIEVMKVPGRGGRPQQSEAYPFAALEVSQKNGEEIVGPSFLIPEDKNPDNVLAAARKRHKGKTFTARKMEGGVRIWRLT